MTNSNEPTPQAASWIGKSGAEHYAELFARLRGVALRTAWLAEDN